MYLATAFWSGKTRYAYDEHGNLIERLQGKRGSAAQTRTRFTWDAAHQLASADVARGPDDTAVAQTFNYAYDALGRRVAKMDAFGATHFAWDGDRMALERRGGNETLHLYHPESFVPLAQVHDGVLHHLHTDHLGTPLEASNDSGEISWRVTYRAWGSVVVEEVHEIEQPVRFQGQYHEVNTGLNYNRYRYFEPGIGRYQSPDPIGLRGGINAFQYAPNPVNWIDPFGLAKKKKPNQANRPADCAKWSLDDNDRECQGHVPGVGHAKYVRKKGTNTWYSVDLTGHGGSAFKMFSVARNTLTHVADLDQFGDIMDKHKSEVGKTVDLDTLQCRDV